jgi:hypothetical protein
MSGWSIKESNIVCDRDNGYAYENVGVGWLRNGIQLIANVVFAYIFCMDYPTLFIFDPHLGQDISLCLFPQTIQKYSTCELLPLRPPNIEDESGD